jgi:hypothetical protein
MKPLVRDNLQLPVFGFGINFVYYKKGCVCERIRALTRLQFLEIKESMRGKKKEVKSVLFSFDSSALFHCVALRSGAINHKECFWRQ